MADERKGALVDKLYEQVSCEYLSELKEPELRPTVLRALARLDPSDYTMEQWSCVLSYITGETVDVRTVEEVAAYLRAKGAPDR